MSMVNRNSHSGPGKVAILLMAVLLAGSLLSACGQKGPLYLPDKQQNEPKIDDGQE